MVFLINLVPPKEEYFAISLILKYFFFLKNFLRILLIMIFKSLSLSIRVPSKSKIIALIF